MYEVQVFVEVVKLLQRLHILFMQLDHSCTEARVCRAAVPLGHLRRSRPVERPWPSSRAVISRNMASTPCYQLRAHATAWHTMQPTWMGAPTTAVMGAVLGKRPLLRMKPLPLNSGNPNPVSSSTCLQRGSRQQRPTQGAGAWCLARGRALCAFRSVSRCELLPVAHFCILSMKLPGSGVTTSYTSVSPKASTGTKCAPAEARGRPLQATSAGSHASQIAMQSVPRRNVSAMAVWSPEVCEAACPGRASAAHQGPSATCSGAVITQAACPHQTPGPPGRSPTAS